MKILVITKTLSEKDGQGRYSLGMIKELLKENELTVLFSGNNPPSDLGDGEKIKIVNIPDLLSSKMRIISLIKYFLLVKKNLSGNDFVHFFTDIPNYLIFSPFMIFQPIPYYITAHGTFSIAYFNKGWQKFFLKRVFKRAKKVFCVSNFTKKEILKRAALNNLEVINNGVDFEKFNLLYNKYKNEIRKTEEKLIISVGAIKPRKGYKYSLLALAELKDKYPDIKYYIVGSQENKSYLNELQNIIKSHGLEKNVIFLENISDDNLAKLYLESDLLLFTPINYGGVYFEGFGLVCLEAGVFEKPVVGSRDCGVEDAVKNGITGFLVPQKDPQKIAEAVEKILSNEALADKLGKVNREFAKNLSWQNVVLHYKNSL